MNLSVVIVTYRVLPFLEQCLSSLLLAIDQTSTEIIVVNNQGGDASDDLIVQHFSNVQLISLKENIGFAKACNIGWRKAQGKHILFLNPDTLVSQQSIASALQQLEQENSCGAVGIRMVDGSGQFLPESKRSFPTIKNAFFKLSGLASLFGKSAYFNAYARPDIANDDIAKIDVLAGAFLMVKKNVLEAINGFDESYFMYGEDIDLCKKIADAGYQLMYIGSESILHFKGESSRKMGWLHIQRFYGAMLQFIGKREKSILNRYLLSLAIFIRALLSFILQAFSKLRAPLSDGILWVFCLVGIAIAWEDIVKEYPFPPWTVLVTNTILLFTMLLFQFVLGSYKTFHSTGKQITNSLLIFVLVLATYSLLPEYLRYSRGVVLTSLLVYSPLRLFIAQIWKQLGWISTTHPYFHSNSYIVCPTSYQRTFCSLLSQLGVVDSTVCISNEAPKRENRFQHIIWVIDEQMPFKKILEYLHHYPQSTYWWHVAGSRGLVSSKQKNSIGSFLFPGKKSSLAQAYQQSMKRFVDILYSILLLPRAVLSRTTRKAILLCLNNRATFIGVKDLYRQTGIDKKVLIYFESFHPRSPFPVDQQYLHQYDWWKELKVLLKHYFLIPQLLQNSRELQ